ncbi:MAG TPA: ergothioneine biosynthesis protein EgtB [Nitrososphaeraceae archaeon]|nr:ergothioneine biosynthesis protein EgtB [Nitrososphaeraceae archaeon]
MTQVTTSDVNRLRSDFLNVRNTTLIIFEPISIEDAVMQSDPFGSTPNWHVAHVTWFFQKILEKYKQNIDADSINTDYLNSYYQRYRKILPKSDRGKFPRPKVSETLKYRSLIEEMFLKFLDNIERNNSLTRNLVYDIELANQHEMQHQELLVYDLQHYFQRFDDAEDNYQPKINKRPKSIDSPVVEQTMVKIPGGLYELGFSGSGFCYDNEVPEHKTYLNSYEIDNYPVTNKQFLAFIDDGGYEDYRFWLSDGWDIVTEKKWNSPLYWQKMDGYWYKKDFGGLNRISPDEPVTNVSYYEADAYSKWAGKRLPTEEEWEKAASWNEDLKKKTLYPWGDELPSNINANLLESWNWAPSQIGSYPQGKSYYGCQQMLGDVWEWTSSEYVLYPGFRSKFSEYTDKWAINQKVLRGGSFATPRSQIRNSYRNYFKPHERIPFSGFRCVRDLL